MDVDSMSNSMTGYVFMDNARSTNLGKLLKEQRISVELTLQEVASKAHVSSSHLGRTERGERFPSAKVLNGIAKPIGFETDELMRLAGYLAEAPKENTLPPLQGHLDPPAAKSLAAEPVERQRQVRL